MSTYGTTDRRRLKVLAIVLLLLALLAAALWWAAGRLGSPLVAGDGAGTEGYRHVRSIYGNGPDRLHRPTEVAVDLSGNIYVADSFKHRIAVFRADGTFVRTVGGPANVEGALRYPGAVAVDSRGRVYVTSKEPSRVVIYNADGSLIRDFEVDEPQTLALTRDRLYITTRNGILIGDLDGNQTGQLSGFGNEPGRIDRPTGMVIDESGTIFLADSLNYRFQAIDSAGEPIWATGEAIDPATAVRDQNRTYGLPADITFGSDGLLYAIDAFNGEILVFTTDGEQIATYGNWGRLDGQFYYPAGIAEVSPELFVVADTFNDRIQILRIPSAAPTPAMQARRALPWLVPLALLGLLVLLARRPVRIVADAAGIRRAESLGLLPELLEQAKVVYVPAGVPAEIADLLAAYEEDLPPKLREVSLGDLEEDADPLFALALELRGKLGLRRVALAFPGVERAEEARELRLGVLEAEEEPGGSPEVQAA